MIEARGLTKRYSSVLAVDDRATVAGATVAGITVAGITVAGITATGAGDPGDLPVRGLAEDQIADIAFAAGIRVHHLAATRVPAARTGRAGQPGKMLADW